MNRYFLLFVKKTLRYLLKPLSFVPALLVMFMIYGYSAQPAVESTAVSVTVTERIVHSINYRLNMEWTPEEQATIVIKAEHYVRKAAHMAEYGLLAVTLAIPFYVYRIRGIWLYLPTLLVCAGYACLDEWHQLHVAGRSGQGTDILIDTFGALLGTLFIHPFCYLLRKTVFSPLSLENMKKRRRHRRR